MVKYIGPACKSAWTSCDEVVLTFLKRLAACLLFMLEFFEKWTFVVNSNSSCELSAHVPTSLSSKVCSIQNCETEGEGLGDLTTAGRHAEGRHTVGKQGEQG